MKLPSAFLLIGAFLHFTLLQASEIPIANASFEQQTITDGSYLVGSIQGWEGTGTYVVANPGDSWFPGTTSGGALPNPIDGLNAGGLNVGATISQDLADVLQAGTTYSLSMLVGRRAGVPFGTPKVSLFAGGQLLAQSSPDAPADGQFEPFEMLYYSPTSGAIVGQALRIEITSIGNDAQPWFDKIRLTNGIYEPPPTGLNLAIANASFEQPTLADGSYLLNSIPGWVGGGAYVVANPQDGWFAGTSSSSPLPNPINGVNAGGINVGGYLYQDLAAVLEAGKWYTLRMLVGHRVGNSFGAPTVSLLAGGQLLARSIPDSPANGQFAPFELSYYSPSNGALVGETLRIELSSFGTDAQAWFDNVRLSVEESVPPPPPPPGGLSIPIINASFEEPVLPDGQFINNTMPGWVGSGTYFPVANPADDWFIGTTAGSGLPNPIDGVNIGGMNVGTTIYQDLTTAVQPGVAYTLRMLVGHRIGVPFGNLTVTLIAAGQVLAQETPVSPLDGKFSPFELVYLSPSNGPAIGQLMRIQLSVEGANAQAWFDDIRLNVGAPPPPTIIAQPLPQTVVTGQTASISVDAIGIPVLQYQWYFGDSMIPNATNRVLDLPQVSMNEAGNYFVVISNVGGAVTSQVASLTVELPPPCVSAPTGAIAWWRFEGSGEDAVGGNPMTFTAPPTFGGGKVAQSLDVGATAGNASVPGNSSLDIGEAEGFTIESWIRPESLSSAQALAEWNNLSGGLGLSIFIGLPVPSGGGAGSLSANFVDTQNHSHVIATEGNMINSGVWQHIAITFTKTNGQARIFVNGAQVASEVLGSFTPQTSPSYHLLVGYRSLSGIQYPFTGRIDELTLYGRALESEEVAMVFGAGAGGKCAGGFAPVIVSNPKNESVVRGDSVEFSVGASGSSPIGFQWRFEGAAIEGATNQNYRIEDVRLDQAGNYSVSVSNEFGISESADAILVVARRATVVRVVDSSGSATTEVAVPVEINANGTENAAGFSLNFDSQKLAFREATLGLDMPEGAALLVNTNELAQGRVGLAVGLPSGSVLAEGAQHLVELHFIVGNILNQTTTSIAFGDIPTLRQISDVQASVLPVVFQNGSILIRSSQFEGDVAPRPNGDRTLATIDWVQMGRYVARLDSIDSTNEFQRADCAPRTTKGNGRLTASDWAQAGRYAIGLDPLTIIGGPTEPEEGQGQSLSAAGDSGRRLVLTNANILPGQTNGVAVVLDAIGDENAVSFSVAFDAAKLRYVGSGKGSGSSGLIINLNTNDISSGHMGVAVAASPGMSMGAGSRELFVIRFAALGAPMEIVPVAFSNSPVPKDVSDLAANTLPTDYVGALVSISELPGPPLSIARSGNSVLVTWTTNSSGFVLEATEGGLGSAWQPVGGVLTLGDQKLAIVNAEGKDRFFRLKKQ